MPRLLLEVIVQSVADAEAATAGGADRLEVVRAIADGGLSPARDLVAAIAAATPLPLRVMVRDAPGFIATAETIARLTHEVQYLSGLGVDGVVIGYARDGVPDLDAVEAILRHQPALPATFHRAFDTLVDPLSAIDAIAALPQIDRILTSGGDCSPAVRCARLQACARRAGERLRILAGGGVDARFLELLAQVGCVQEAHVGRAAREGDDPGAPVSAARVRQLRALAGV
jgi:copper homeostasis protein